jgi:hypothetical protein
MAIDNLFTVFSSADLIRVKPFSGKQALSRRLKLWAE